MRMPRSLALCVVVAALLSACGGGGGDAGVVSPGVDTVVSFGDSLSDIGTYAVGGFAAPNGGKWTVNSSSARGWTELVTTRYGLTAQCAAQTGMPHVEAMPLAFPDLNVPVQDHAGCRNYAQGSARVAHPAGPGSEGAWQIVYSATLEANLGNTALATTTANYAAPQRYMALPIEQQMAKVSSYTGRELVTVLAGANDAFMQANGVRSAAAGGAPAVVAGLLAGWDSRSDWLTLQAKLIAGGNPATSAAFTAAFEGMNAAATTLAQQVQAQRAKGATRILVVKVPDISVTPFAVSDGPSTQDLFRSLVSAFNSTLGTALNGVAGVVLVDAYTASGDQYYNPAKYGLSNVSTPACSTTNPDNPINLDLATVYSRGSAIGCSESSTIVADTSTYLFADGVHPTPMGYQLLADLVINALLATGWLL